MPPRIFSRVDLPVPLAPTMPTRSRGPIVQSRFSNSSLGPKRLPPPEIWIMGTERLYPRRGISHRGTENTENKNPILVFLGVLGVSVAKESYLDRISWKNATARGSFDCPSQNIASLRTTALEFVRATEINFGTPSSLGS